MRALLELNAPRHTQLSEECVEPVSECDLTSVVFTFTRISTHECVG